MRVSTSSACSRQAGSLCAGSLNAGQQAALQLAAAPQAWDSRDAYGRSGAQVVGPVKEQGSCGAWCVLPRALYNSCITQGLPCGDLNASNLQC
jgi:hypothetical protein